MVQERGVQLGMTLLDGTNIWVHRPAAGTAQKGAAEPDAPRVRLSADLGAALSAMPTSLWGIGLRPDGAKACVIADGSGRAIAFGLAPDQAHELPQAISLLARLSGVPRWVVADRGYTSHTFREHIWNLAPGWRSHRSGTQHRSPVLPGSTPIDREQRSRWVERLGPRREEWRAIATRYEKRLVPLWASSASLQLLTGSRTNGP